MVTETKIRPGLGETGETEEGEKDTGPEFVDPDGDGDQEIIKKDKKDDKQPEKPKDINEPVASNEDPDTPEYRQMQEDLEKLTAERDEAYKTVKEFAAAQGELGKEFSTLFEVGKLVEKMEAELEPAKSEHQRLKDEAAQLREKRAKLSPVLNWLAVSRLNNRLQEISDVTKKMLGKKDEKGRDLKARIERAEEIRECYKKIDGKNDMNIRQAAEKASIAVEQLERKMREYKYERQHNTGQ